MSDEPEFDPEAVLEQSRHDPLPCPIGMDDAPFICSAGVCDGLVCTQSRLFRAYVANESLRAERACLLAIKDAAAPLEHHDAIWLRELAKMFAARNDRWNAEENLLRIADRITETVTARQEALAALSALPEDPAGG